MLRFGISLVAASLIALAGYSAFGQATVAAPALKTIAVVTARAHHRAVSSAPATSTAPALLL
jgi:hypothetical protein